MAAVQLPPHVAMEAGLGGLVLLAASGGSCVAAVTVSVALQQAVCLTTTHEMPQHVQAGRYEEAAAQYMSLLAELQQPADRLPLLCKLADIQVGREPGGLLCGAHEPGSASCHFQCVAAIRMWPLPQRHLAPIPIRTLGHVLITPLPRLPPLLLCSSSWTKRAQQPRCNLAWLRWGRGRRSAQCRTSTWR